MSVLLFRPDKTLTTSVEAFRKEGVSIVGVPLMLIEPLSIDMSAKMQASPPGSLCIFTSQNAVSSLGKSHLDWPAHLIYLAVGPSTARALKHLNVQCNVPETHDSEGLLLLPYLQQGRGRSAFLFKGQGGRTLLPDTLVSRGFELFVTDCYRRSPNPTPPEFSHADIRCIVATSGELVKEAFKHYNHDWLRSLPWVVVSERTATIAEDYGITNYRISNGANDGALISCVHQFLE